MTDTPVHSGPERVAKIIARSGVASRRDAEKMILEGRVAVNGKTIDTPALDVLPKDKVTIDGKPIDAPQETRLWLYYKPLGLVTTEKDDQGRRTIFDEMPEGMPRVLNVGRLDLNSEGLLLLTNDGGLKRRLEHPETAWLRKYRVRVNGRPSNDTFNPLREGITIDGEDFQPMEVTLDRQQGANAWLTVGIREGKNREIRRAMNAINLTVNRLIRVSYGPFRLNDMQPGDVTEVKRKVLRDQLGDRLLSGIEDGRPARSELAKRPVRPARGPRPEEDGPRKGFGRQRDFAEDGARPARSAGFRSHRDEDARPEGRPFGKKPFEARDGERSFDRKPYEKREGDRPAGRSFDKRDGERPAGRSFEKREGDRPFGKKPYEKRDGERPAGRSFEKREGDRPFGKKPYEKRDGDRPAGRSFEKRDGDRPFGKKPYEKRDGDRPAGRSFEKREGDRPFSRGPRSEGAEGERPRKEGGFKSAGYKSHGGGGKPRAQGFKSHRGDAPAPRRPGGKPGPKRG